jgi:hypothetical protein
MKPTTTAKPRRRAHRKVKPGSKGRITEIFDPRPLVKNRRIARE